jgi:putative nucleotidyltransferase-like protein
MTRPVPAIELIAEARRLNALAHDEGIAARLLGGAAVVLSTSQPLPVVLQRPYKDLDYVVRRSDSRRWRDLLEANGYEADVNFNSLHGSQRLLHFDTANNRQLDTFVSAFSMCHTIDLEDRLPDESPTLAPEDILLTKLQIFEINDKDLIDTIALLLSHPIATGSEPGINRERLTKVVGADWGWFTTVSDNLAKVAARLQTVGLDDADTQTVSQRLAQLHDVMAAAPKTLKWRARARVGRRLPWYDLPEEVD